MSELGVIVSDVDGPAVEACVGAEVPVVAWPKENGFAASAGLA